MVLSLQPDIVDTLNKGPSYCRHIIVGFFFVGHVASNQSDCLSLSEVVTVMGLWDVNLQWIYTVQFNIYRHTHMHSQIYKLPSLLVFSISWLTKSHGIAASSSSFRRSSLPWKCIICGIISLSCCLSTYLCFCI